MNPFIQAAVGVGTALLTSPRAPSQQQVDAAFAQTQAANRQNWIIGGGIAAAALLVYLVASRR